MEYINNKKYIIEIKSFPLISYEIKKLIHFNFYKL